MRTPGEPHTASLPGYLSEFIYMDGQDRVAGSQELGRHIRQEQVLIKAFVPASSNTKGSQLRGCSADGPSMGAVFSSEPPCS